MRGNRSGDLTLKTAAAREERQFGRTRTVGRRKTLTKKQGNEHGGKRAKRGDRRREVLRQERRRKYLFVAVILLLGDERFVIVGEGHEPPRGTRRERR